MLTKKDIPTLATGDKVRVSKTDDLCYILRGKVYTIERIDPCADLPFDDFGIVCKELKETRYGGIALSSHYFEKVV